VNLKADAGMQKTVSKPCLPALAKQGWLRYDEADGGYKKSEDRRQNTAFRGQRTAGRTRNDKKQMPEVEAVQARL